MVIIGVDAHKRMHAAVAVDAAGTILGEWKGPNTAAGWHELWTWANSFSASRQWGIEGAWNYGRGLAQYLVTSGEQVFEVNPRWTAQRRRRARRAGKSDRLDAHAVAQLVREESSTLPQIACDDETAVLELLTTEREAALAEATRLRNHLHQLLLQTVPNYSDHLPSLTSESGLRAAETFEGTTESPLQQQRAAAIRRTAQRLRLALQQVEVLADEIRSLAAIHFAPLTQLCGVQLLTAGALAGILGPGRRFKSEAQLAMYAGVAPLETSSAGVVRHRLNRGGNRRLNAILYRIALAQARGSDEARAYLARRRAEGKSWQEAMRALKRHLIRAIWRLWQQCLSEQEQEPVLHTA
jgi:transposase